MNAPAIFSALPETGGLPGAASAILPSASANPDGAMDAASFFALMMAEPGAPQSNGAAPATAAANAAPTQTGVSIANLRAVAFAKAPSQPQSQLLPQLPAQSQNPGGQNIAPLGVADLAQKLSAPLPGTGLPQRPASLAQLLPLQASDSAQPAIPQGVANGGENLPAVLTNKVTPSGADAPMPSADLASQAQKPAAIPAATQAATQAAIPPAFPVQQLAVKSQFEIAGGKNTPAAPHAENAVQQNGNPVAPAGEQKNHSGLDSPGGNAPERNPHAPRPAALPQTSEASAEAKPTNAAAPQEPARAASEAPPDRISLPLQRAAAPLPQPGQVQPAAQPVSDTSFAIQTVQALAPRADTPLRFAAAAAKPDAAPAFAELALRIAHKSASGENRFDIRLDPPELGRIHVRLDVDARGQTQAQLSADRPQTLELLQRDAGTLERALKDAGLNLAGGLNFSLKGGGRQARERGGDHPQPGELRVEPGEADLPHPSMIAHWRGHVFGGAGRLDITI